MGKSQLICEWPEGKIQGSIRKYKMKYNGTTKEFLKCYFHGINKHFFFDKYGDETLNMAKKWLEESVPLVAEREKELLIGQHQKYMQRNYIEMETKKDKLPRWDYKNAFDPKENYTMALIGSTKSGKSTFLDYLIPKINNMYDLIVLFSVNAHAKVYDKLKKLHNLMAFEQFIPEVVEDLHKFNKKTDNSLKFLILMDDEINNKYSSVVKNMFCTYRNANISSIFSGQDYTFLAKNVRNNINYVFIFKQNAEESINDVIDKFLKGTLNEVLFGKMSAIAKRKLRKDDKYEIMYKFVKSHTEDHNILVLDILNDFKLYQFKVNL